MAMNPTDCKYINCLAPLGVHVGCDYAGIVQEVGKNVNPQGTRLQVGSVTMRLLD
ncbi:hypothetical protein BDV35DRAFT_334625 [Aspergillus flavus]|uniref:Uncharacterized protein n=1 Tax=Aspergillus flavus TaxID=5059 RepID=A0A5N6HHE6_ASPFL|nr:hypothetical protein BDV35DRAFT_334625 [Aspergillus flavus]